MLSHTRSPRSSRAFVSFGALLVSWSLLLVLSPCVTADFIYPDFNETLGLAFNGAAATTSCEVGIDLTERSGFENTADEFGETGGMADEFEENALHQQGEKSAMQSRRSVTTNVADDFSESIQNFNSKIGHRDHFTSSKTTRCGGRLRLTPSAPSKKGSVFHTKLLPVAGGFDTILSFHISDHSRTCSKHMDPSFGLVHHESCSVHGGDGLAFVITPEGPDSLGSEGSGLGYAGIKNALVVELDTWTNVPSIHAAHDDIFEDHVAIHSSGREPVAADSTSALGASRPFELADGSHHLVRVSYLPYLHQDYFGVMTANENLIPYMKDNAEARRLGTLAVFIDEGVETDTPLLAIPINLSVLLDLNNGEAYAGFTASTGEKWEKHDITSWIYCDAKGCDDGSDIALFDYHQQSKYHAARHNYNDPGVGYGGTGGKYDDAPTRHESPNTDPWHEEPSRTASGFSNELSEEAALQVPPNVPN